jgi:Glycosyl hydrolase family 26
VQAGNSKTNCIYVGSAPTIYVTSGISPLAQAEANTGVTFNCLETFSDADPAWSDWVSPWMTAPETYYGYHDWLAADPTHRTIIITQDLVPDDVINNNGDGAYDTNWIADCAAGTFAKYATQLSTINTGFGYSVIRLGHEMNGTWYRDSLPNTTAGDAAWAGCFAQIVTAMRAVPGAHFLFDWNVNANYRNIPLASFYPGNQYVDIIGIDAYDGSGVTLPPASDPTRFSVLANETLGLNAVEAFARQQGKPLSIPEWGVVTLATGSNPGGDDPNYVTGMANFVANNDVAYQSYFDGDPATGVMQLDPSQAPLSLAAYAKDF